MLFLLLFVILLALSSNSYGNTVHQRIIRQTGNPCMASDGQLRNCTTVIPSPSPSSNANNSKDLSNNVVNIYSICGQGKKPQKILSGKNVTLGEWPWIAAIGYHKGTNSTVSWKCEGTLISDKWVITAAHCAQGLGGFVLTTVRLGDLNLNDDIEDGASPVDIKVSQSIIHPQYSSRILSNDIALLRLNSSVTFTENIRPICILNKEEHKNDDFYVKKLPFVAGWRSTQSETLDSRLIDEFQVGVIDLKNCSEEYKSNGFRVVIDERVLCTRTPDRNRKDCKIDFDSSLMIPIGTRFHLAGISSYATECSTLPPISTRVAYFTNWIRQTTGIEI